MKNLITNSNYKKFSYGLLLLISINICSCQTSFFTNKTIVFYSDEHHGKDTVITKAEYFDEVINNKVYHHPFVHPELYYNDSAFIDSPFKKIRTITANPAFANDTFEKYYPYTAKIVQPINSKLHTIRYISPSPIGTMNYDMVMVEKDEDMIWTAGVYTNAESIPSNSWVQYTGRDSVIYFRNKKINVYVYKFHSYPGNDLREKEKGFAYTDKKSLLLVQTVNYELNPDGTRNGTWNTTYIKYVLSLTKENKPPWRKWKMGPPFK